MKIQDYKKFLDNLLGLAIKQNASDIHFSSSRKPILRIDGVLEVVSKSKEVNSEGIKEILKIMLSQEDSNDRFSKFSREREIDFSYNFKELGRFRGNAYFQQSRVSCSLRFISRKIKTIEELDLPSILHLFARAHQGFVLVTGPSSHGKSTTLAALIDEINHTRRGHIITVEDPVEYQFEDDLSIVDQREVYTDTLSFARALRSTFRQDPDVIMVGEMRDPETIATAITAAETGHLVFATLHTNSAAQTIHRIVDSFDGHSQRQIRAQLSGSLLGIISQRLLPKIGGGLIPATEIIFNNPAISNLIRENKIHEIPVVMETSSEEGMISMNK
ncbi:MAG: PilT/PilU family type 4a pilus ATPase, partial [Acidobacteriota bacterium]|nr:PilT/PilU family type 4a pilus ATPase [Acidobacteriota bacterium]